jgi:hypothetical protein
MQPVWDRACAGVPSNFRPLIEVVRDLNRADACLGPSVEHRRALSVVPVTDLLCTSKWLPACTEVTYARIYAMAALASDGPAKDAIEAILCLEKASLSGYFRKTARLTRVESEPIFDHLKVRRDYAEFDQRATAR